MAAAVAGGVPVKGAPLLPTMRLLPGVRTPQKQAHHGSPSRSKPAVALLTPEGQTPHKEVRHDSLPPSKAIVPPLGRPRQHPVAPAPAQCFMSVHHSPAVHCGKRPSAPSQSYTRGGGLAAAAATSLYRRRCCSVARTVSHDNYDHRCRTAVRMSRRTPRCHRRRVRTAAADPRWYRNRCCYRCTAAGTVGYHSRCRRCDRCMTGATLVNRSRRCRCGRYG